MKDDDLTSAYLLGAYDASREWRDAAEFEERVNRKLITTLVWAYDDGWDDHLNGREYKMPDLEDALRWARLEVEEEME